VLTLGYVEMGEELQVLEVFTVLLIYVPSAVLLLTYTVMYYVGRKHREEGRAKRAFNDRITVAIPVRNEPIEYIDEALASISSWSIRDLIEVVIVSDDIYEAYQEIERVAKKWRDQGVTVYVIWRREPRGYKAGALNTALWFSPSRYFYVMDVDSRVAEDFIVEACSLMEENPGIAAVVSRWRGRNRETRVAEAVSSSMEFMVEALYRGRRALNLPVFPLGTGTVYRTSVLREELGGWDENRLLDDLEIGCRIMRLGRGIAYMDRHWVYVEVPRRLSSLRIQQERWVYGAVDVAIARLRDILSSSQPWYAKLEALIYLLQYLPAIAVFIGFLLLTLITTIKPYDVLFNYWYIGVAWIAVAALYALSFIDSLREKGYSTWKALVNLGRASAITVVLSPVFAKAFLKASLRLRAAFKRTPKGRYEARASNAKLRFPVEALIGIYALVYSIHLITNRILFCGGWFLTYSLGYIYSLIRWWRDIVYR